MISPEVPIKMQGLSMKLLRLNRRSIEMTTQFLVDLLTNALFLLLSMTLLMWYILITEWPKAVDTFLVTWYLNKNFKIFHISHVHECLSFISYFFYSIQENKCNWMWYNEQLDTPKCVVTDQTLEDEPKNAFVPVT